jgi:hypothetical protein
LWYIYTIKFYSAKRNKDLWFGGKWMQLEDITLSEVSQDEKDKVEDRFKRQTYAQNI